MFGNKQLHQKSLKIQVVVALFVLLLGSGTIVLPSFIQRPERFTEKKDYLDYVQTFANTIIEKGLDNYGPKRTPMWCAVMDTRDFSVPRDGVPTVEGIRPGDRAVGGSNFYHDVKTLNGFRMLSSITKDPKYEKAANEYTAYFLKNAQSSSTGLLGWGEHLYYDLFTDSVTIAERYKVANYGGYFHELLHYSPPWENLWKIDSARTSKAIAGIRFHFFEPDPKTYLFNRHATWDKAGYQSVETAQPWIKHSGLYAHAFMFLYNKTGNKEWLDWSRGIGSLYWEHRNPATNLTMGCIGDPRPTSKHSVLNGTALLSYFLLRAYEQNSTEKEFLLRAKSLLKSADRYSWNRQSGQYYSSLHLDGTPVRDEKTGKPGLLGTWVSGYGISSILEYGRIAAYFALTQKDEDFEMIARRCLQIARSEPLPQRFVAENMADAVHLSLDLYDLTSEKSYLEDAKKYADLGIEKLWKNGVFVRQANDFYYESKLGIGSFAEGLLRLHLLLTPQMPYPGMATWRI